MHNSDINTVHAAGRRRGYWLTGALILSLVGFTGLGVYSWQLQRELAGLRSTDGGSGLSALAGLEAPAAPSPLSGTAADPFQQMEAFRQQMDTMMNSFFGGALAPITGVPGLSQLPGNSLFGADPFAGMGLSQPAMSLRETDSTLEIVIPVQEGQQVEVNTDVESDRLTVAGTLTWASQDNANGVVSSRRSSSQFSRTIMLPDNVNPAGLATEHRGNEIVITLPKAS